MKDKLIYSGQWKDDMKHGIGLKYENDVVIYGYWIKNVLKYKYY